MSCVRTREITSKVREAGIHREGMDINEGEGGDSDHWNESGALSRMNADENQPQKEWLFRREPG